jgi:hypothetical protein
MSGGLPRADTSLRKGFLMAPSHSPEKLLAATRICALRKFLELSPAELASELDVPTEVLQDWEKGTQTPSPENFITLGNLAGDPSCWFFWACAGLYSSEFMRVLPPVRLNVLESGELDLSVVHAGAGKRLFSRPQLHAIPILPVRVATPGLEGDRVEDLRKVPASGVIASPSDWCPNPGFTSCLRVAGNSMEPLIGDGYIIVVDTSQVEHDKLDGEVVVAWEKTHGLVLGRFAVGVDQESLVSTNPEYAALVTRKEKPWRIIGKVLWWVGRDTPLRVLAAEQARAS